MTDPTPQAVPEKGLLARVAGVIFSPGATYRAVAAHPRPAGIMFVACLVISVAAGLPQFTARGRQATLDLQVQQTERLTGQSVTPEQYARMEQFGRYGAYVAIVSTFIFLPVVAVILAGVCWVIFNGILAGTATFKQVLAVITHAQVIGALGVLAAAPMIFVGAATSMTGPFNFSALAPMLPPGSLLGTFLGAVNFFTLWQVIVVSIGLGVLYRRSTSGIAMGLVATYLVLTLAFASVASSFMGR